MMMKDQEKMIGVKIMEETLQYRKTILSKYNTLNHLAENIYDAHGNLELDFIMNNFIFIIFLRILASI